MYIYEGHLGSLYYTEEPQDFDMLYCDTCGDCDQLLGIANNKKEARALFKDSIWIKSYIKEFIDSIPFD